MGKDPRIIRIRESILESNRTEARHIRDRLDAAGVQLVNVMASPGAGKTSLILATTPLLIGCLSKGAGGRITVIEADIDSTVDSDRMIAAGIPAVQIQTGGFCHVDATMVGAALDELWTELHRGDIVFLENVGNLICTAQHETGAHLNVAVLSVPEGDDKPLKYPVMFQAADVVVINKVDYLEIAEFDLEAAVERVRVLNKSAEAFPISCRTGVGVEEWGDWLCRRLNRSR